MGRHKDMFYGYGSYGNYADTGSDWLREQYHLECEFPDTGFAVSYCKICECKGIYNFKLGKYIKEEST